MRLSQPRSRLVVPSGLPEAEALARTTHLGVGAHPDDLELMTWHAILACFGAGERWFTGVVVTDGAGSPRAGAYAGMSDDEMVATRLAEQIKAAVLGDYSAVACLGFASETVQRPQADDVVADLTAILQAARPKVVYTHSPFDAHDTHVAVAVQVIRAIRGLPAEQRPVLLYGCEVWRGHDWLVGSDRVALAVGGREHLAVALAALHDSQIAGGKRYDLAALGRRRANATYSDAHSVDDATAVELAVDLTPLIRDPALDIRAFALEVVRRFGDDVAARLGRLLG